MNDSKALIRQWRLLRRLADARTGYTVKEIQQETGVSIETVRRDLQDLTDAGFRVREAMGYRGVKRWQVEERQKDLSQTLERYQQWAEK